MGILSNYRRRRVEKNLINGVRENTQKIKNGRDLSAAQEREIKQYWHDLLGIEIPLDWHRYFYKRTGVYSVKYIPTSLYYTDLIGRLNQFPMNEAYTDKNLSYRLLPAEHQPEAVIRNMNGYYYANDTPINKQKAVELCENMDDVLIKPTLKSHGDGVCKFHVKNGITSIGDKRIDQLFDEYSPNFIIQKAVHQHTQMNALNSSSVNTIRILTYRSGNEILVLYTVIRIGRQGSDVDNETAGGISTRILADGTLAKYAFGAPGNDNVEKTDTGVVLDGYAVPSYSEAVELVKKMHLLLPHFNLVGWDIAIDTEGKPVIIEFNTWPELSQSANGPAFGDYTERVLREIWNRPNTRYF